MKPWILPLAALFVVAPLPDAATVGAGGWLGVYLTADREVAVVAEVIPGSPAARVGLQAGDELLAVDDTATPTRDAFLAAIAARRAGDRLQLTLRRGGARSTVVVELGERPLAAGGPAPVSPSPPLRRPASPRPEAEVAPIEPVPPAPRAYLGLRVRGTEHGLLVEAVVPGGPTHGCGIRPGARITGLGDRPIQSLRDLDAVLERSAPGRRLALGLQDAAGARSVVITLGERPGDDPSPLVPAAAVPAERLQHEVDALRRELQELRRQLEALQRQPAAAGGRE
jgi:S1-C subfamily serine protease